MAKSVMPSKATILAGGNPRVAKADGDAAVQAYIAAIPAEWKREIARRLDATITNAVPDAKKAIKWNSPFYGVEHRGWFLSFHCYSKYVKVAFFRGKALRPMPPGESTREDVRYIDLHQDEAFDAKRIAAWVKQASALPGWLSP